MPASPKVVFLVYGSRTEFRVKTIYILSLFRFHVFIEPKFYRFLKFCTIIQMGQNEILGNRFTKVLGSLKIGVK